MRSLRAGRILGIPIELDASLLIVLPAIAWLVGARIGRWVDILGALPRGAIEGGALAVGPTPWLLGGVAAVGLFVAVLLHELGHSVVAMRYDCEIESIRLWLFGGVAQFADLPERPREEFLIALAGPAVSVAIGGVAYAGFTALPAAVAVPKFVLGYLAVMNLALAAFNLLPAFPMDGGRVLRAILARSRPYVEATRIAATVGKGMAVLLGLVGLLYFDLILVGIAFFVYLGAASESRRVELEAAFEGVTVGDVMTPGPEVRTVTEDVSVAALTDRMLAERHTGYPVLDETGDLAGIVTLSDLEDVAAVEQEAKIVADVLTRELETVAPEDDPTDALERMQQADVGRLPVVDENGELVGLLSRTDVMRALSIGRVSGLGRGGDGEDPAEFGTGRA